MTFEFQEQTEHIVAIVRKLTVSRAVGKKIHPIHPTFKDRQ